MAEKKKSELSRAFSEDGALKTHVGGQALLEGIMMRGKLNWAVAVREPDGGIYTESHELGGGRRRGGWTKAPLARGCRALVESLVIGFKALEIAAEHAFPEEDEDESEGEGGRQGARPFSWKDDFGRPDEAIDALGAQRGLEIAEEPADEKASRAAEEKTPEQTAVKTSATALVEQKKKDGEGALPKGAMAASMAIGVVLGVALFIVVPAAITNLIVGDYGERTLLWNVVDGILRVAVFVFYIWLIGRMSDIKRMFAYHGAEHKTIHCYEHGLPLAPENARSFPRLHVRCGTAFLIMVMIIAILVYTIVPINLLIDAIGVPEGIPTFVLLIAVRIVLMPVIAGVSYEITVRWAGSHPDNLLVKVVLWPGMQMQYLTTREPDDSMIECAIAAMQIVLEREEREAEASTCKQAPAKTHPADAAA